MTRQSSIQSSPSPFALPPPSSSTSKITTHHSTIINPYLAIPVRPSFAFFFHFKNHHSSIANHQSIPRLPPSPCLRLLLPTSKIINHQSSIHSSPSPFALPPPSSSTSKITNHHSPIIHPFLAFPLPLPSAFFFPLQKSPIIHPPIINPFLAFPVRPASAIFFHIKNQQSSLDNHQSNGLLIAD